MRSLARFFGHLPYVRLACLILAAVQLMPLPDEPENWPSRSLGVVRVGLNRGHTVPLGRRDSYAA